MSQDFFYWWVDSTIKYDKDHPGELEMVIKEMKESGRIPSQLPTGSGEKS